MSIALRLRNLVIAELFLALQIYRLYKFFESKLEFDLLSSTSLLYCYADISVLSGVLLYLLALTSALLYYLSNCGHLFGWDQFLATSICIPAASSCLMAWLDFSS